MKKALIGAAVLGFSTASAFAQSSVTLYGVIDTGLEFANGGAGTQVRETNNSIFASRWGLTGVEDLGGNLHADFKLENGFLPNNGTAVGGLQFGRESWVGLSGAFGAVRFGVNYTPLHDMLTVYGPRGFGSGLSWGNASAYYLFTPLARASNSVDYRSPTFYGLSTRVFYGLGTNDGTTVGAPKTLGNTGSLSLNYAVGHFGANATYTNQRYSTLTAAQTLTAQTQTFAGDYYALGAYYDFGFIRPSVIWAMHRDGPNVASAISSNFSNPKNNQLEVGAQIPMGLFAMLVLDYGRYTRLGNSAGDSQAYTVRVDYLLSKRTTLYAGTAYIHNGALAAFAPDGIGSPAPTAVMGHNVTSVLAGIVQKF
jgi:predicted porin